MYVQKVLSRKLYQKYYFFVRSQWRKYKDPDPLVRGHGSANTHQNVMDP